MQNKTPAPLDIDQEALKGAIQKQASAYTLEIEVAKNVIEPFFNQYWAEVKDRLHPAIIQEATKGGYRTVQQDRAVKAAGGISEFYKPILNEVVFKYLDGQARQALTINDVNATETPGNYIVRAVVHLEPEVTWKGVVPGIDEPLTIKVPKEPDNMVDRLVESELVGIQQNSINLVNIPDATKPIEPGQVGVFNVDSSVDGEPWKEASFTAKKWLVDASIFQVPELYAAVVGMVAEEVKMVEFVLDEKFGDKAGKKALARVQLVQAYDRKVPAIDDDLAKGRGLNDLTALKADVRLKVEEYLKRSREELVGTSIFNSIFNTNVVEVEAVPFLWMMQKAREIYMQSRDMVRTEEDLIATFKHLQLMDGTPVTDKDTALMFLAQKSAQQLVSDLVFRSWGRKANVEGDQNLDNLRNYAEAVKKHVRNNAVIEEYTVEEQPVTQEVK